MSGLRVVLERDPPSYEPLEEVKGVASWELPEPPAAVEVRLFWYTSGRGDRDQDVVAVERQENPGPSGRLPFTLQLPQAPWTFSGQLVSLVWAVEVVLPEENLAGDAELVMGPGGEEARVDGEPEEIS